ncbi:peptidoglycan D,D-transpeptidase FtsI family protein [Enterocloster lavalensis]|uniref:peptidoglycan D,D-transpeptidase FtsI family protein n=1 Tax=Enterocloster lavalensis TaxID=460384 RepID=UPI002A818607|nr:penicillin-binding transpeptidase domain-containing protein [Enterocloster lavalensis]
MYTNLTSHRKRTAVLGLLISLAMIVLTGRLGYLMLFCSEHYSQMAEDLHQRERTIKAARGRIIDANGVVIADNRTVCTISVIHSQITDPELVVSTLCDKLGLDRELVQKKVEKRSSREIIKTNVDKPLGDAIRDCKLNGVKVDEDYKRYYPYDSLASKVLGFTGGDNQGIIGLEVKYEPYLKGRNGTILTMTDARGVELENAAEDRIEPIAGNDLRVSLDVNIQKYAEQLAYQVLEKKNAKAVSIIVMNPQNGEIMAMVNAPEFNLNDPFTLDQNLRSEALRQQAAERSPNLDAAGRQDLLNKMWRNRCINDTYEPGSTFKIITAAAGLEAGVVKLTDQFSCPGFRVVDDRKIRCHKVGGHGGETFLQGAMNSCNPVFIDVGLRLGVDYYYKYFTQFGLKGKTGIDLPGEAATIMHKKENMGNVELATVAFGQSFQITPMQLVTTAASIVNGGNRVTPHFGVEAVSADGTAVHKFTYPVKEGIVSPETSETMRFILEQVVAEGSGKKAKVEGFRIGGKTATSEKLPRSLKKYISSFLGFAPANDPKVIALITIDEPEGIYYGGTIAAPVVGDLFKNILPYLGIPAEEEESVSPSPNGS